MSMSLREQLLQAGLGTRKQAREADQKERQLSNPRNRRGGGDNGRQADARAAEQQRVAQAQAAKAARDRELNRKREEQAQNKARWAQIRQLIEQHRLAKLEGGDYFNFINRGKVRRILVDAERRERLAAGTLVIVRCEGRYDVVLPEIGERIAALDARAVVPLGGAQQPDSATDSGAEGTEDPYKDFVVPDDLMW